MTDLSNTERLVRFTNSARFESLDSTTILSTKRVILDTIGCAFGGHATRASSILLKVNRVLGGSDQASIIGTRERSAVTGAAFMNAELANLLDADETLLMLAHHANSIVAASLAVGELTNATGEELITAVAVGYDVAARIGMSLDVRQEPGTGTEFGPLSGMAWMIFGCASAAGRLLQLTEHEMMNAYGLAAMCAPVPYLGRWERTPPTNRAMTKYEFYGPLTANGVLAVLLAKEGFVGDKHSLDGEVGFWRLYGAKGWRPELLARDLAVKWWINDTSFKPNPGCRHITIAIDLFEEIAREHRLAMEEIESIVVRANPVLAERGFGTFPQNEVDMLFSVPYLLAVAGVGDFRAGPDWVHPERLRDPKVQNLAAKVTLERNPNTSAAIKAQLANEGFYKRVPTEVSVSARGTRFTARAEFARGDPWSSAHRMSDETLACKFRRMSQDRLDSEQAELVIDRIMHLESEKALRDFMALLVPGPNSKATVES